ncbi:hypothetical protein FVP33_03450 [Lacisediminihabitans profunda]|uniref:Transcriptional regulator LacI/GalR-like sensor domain-containing protein n=1 Tax=Lacisediminihabitans profunda TaxID=2594790 RepID=A0A5C8UTM5_9MICO|nr:hypothetical protein FVP33_03450 [Lacisediminihabitans profunda]
MPVVRNGPAVASRSGVLATRCSSFDSIAAGALDVLRESNRRVPEDVGVVGFDDSAWALRCRPALSMVRQPADQLGRMAAQRVLAQLRGDDTPGEGTLLETSIVWRDSA